MCSAMSTFFVVLAVLGLHWEGTACHSQDEDEPGSLCVRSGHLWLILENITSTHCSESKWVFYSQLSRKNTTIFLVEQNHDYVKQFPRAVVKCVTP